MPKTKQIRFELTDVLGRDLDDAVCIDLSQVGASTRYRHTSPVRARLTLNGIDVTAGGLYLALVSPSHYRPRGAFVNLENGNAVLRFTFPILPQKVRGLVAPPYTQLPAALRHVLSETAYSNLGLLRKACLLNLAAKAETTRLDDGTSPLDHIGKILEIRQDRLFASARASLVEAVSCFPVFQPANGSLHRVPKGYTRTRSFKTRDPHGSLQLTFFRRCRGGNDYIVDADIDEARGIEHIFEVVRRALTGPTHPYDVREILIASQGIDPGYRFQLR